MEKKSFSYNRYLRWKMASNAEYGLVDMTESIDWLQAHFGEINFTRFITVTFEKPQTDPFKVEKYNQSIVNRLRRCFYGRSPIARENLLFFFAIEDHPIRVYGIPDYHVHFLMSEPIDSRREWIPSGLTRTIYHDSLVKNCVFGGRFTGRDSSYRPAGNVLVLPIGNQADRIAYLSKALATSDKAWIPDLRNSSFPKYTDAKGKGESAH